MLAEGRVGPFDSPSGDRPIRLARTGEAVVVDAHGRYYEPAVRKTLYLASNSGGVTTSAGLATTYVGCVLSNPVGSPVNLAIYKVMMNQVVIQATNILAFGIAAGYNATTNVTHTTPLITYSTFFNGAQNISQGKADSSATLPTAPVFIGWLGGTATASQDSTGPITLDFEGSLIIPPGGYVLTTTNVASPASAIVSAIYWEEVAA